MPPGCWPAYKAATAWWPNTARTWGCGGELPCRCLTHNSTLFFIFQAAPTQLNHRLFGQRESCVTGAALGHTSAAQRWLPLHRPGTQRGRWSSQEYDTQVVCAAVLQANNGRQMKAVKDYGKADGVELQTQAREEEEQFGGRKERSRRRVQLGSKEPSGVAGSTGAQERPAHAAWARQSRGPLSRLMRAFTPGSHWQWRAD